MKARNIKRLRKKISKKGYWEKRLKELAKMESKLEDFGRFECSSFFVGQLQSEINTRKYNERFDFIHNRIDWYKKKCDFDN